MPFREQGQTAARISIPPSPRGCRLLVGATHVGAFELGERSDHRVEIRGRGLLQGEEKDIICPSLDRPGLSRRKIGANLRRDRLRAGIRDANELCGYRGSGDWARQRGKCQDDQ